MKVKFGQTVWTGRVVSKGHSDSEVELQPGSVPEPPPQSNRVKGELLLVLRTVQYLLSVRKHRLI